MNRPELDHIPAGDRFCFFPTDQPYVAQDPITNADITDGAGVRGSFIHGDVNDLRGTVNRDVNTIDPQDPRFDNQFAPRAPQYAAVGYRPVKVPTADRRTP